MEPNNMNPAGMPNMQNQPGMGSQSVGQNAMEQALAETSASPAPASVPMGAPVKKSGKGMLYGMIVFMILAIGGIGFGAWAMMDGNSKVTNLEKQNSDLKAQNNQLLEQIAEGGGSSDNDSDTTPSVNTEDYIYVGEWGLKIKKPEDWKNTVRVYSYYNGYPQAADSLDISEYYGVNGAGVAVTVMKGWNTCDDYQTSNNAKCFVVDGMVISVNELVGGLESPNSSTASEAFLNHFYNPENYSRI